jgi:hypothetical protein
MEYDDRFDPTMPNDVEQARRNDILKEYDVYDNGVNYIQVKFKNAHGEMKRKRVKVYTSGVAGTLIRDAETGEYLTRFVSPNGEHFHGFVGSNDEELFFKVTFATGECNSQNGSTTAFYSTPYHYMKHMESTVDAPQIAAWEQRRAKRIKEIEGSLKKKPGIITYTTVR